MLIMYHIQVLVKHTKHVKMENVMLGLKKSLPERAWRLLPENEKAIVRGGEIIQRVK